MSKTLTKTQLRCLEVIAFLRQGEDRWWQSGRHYPVPGDRMCFYGAWGHLYGAKELPASTGVSPLDIFEINDSAKDFDEMAAGMQKLFGI